MDVDPELRDRVQRNIHQLLGLHNEMHEKEGLPQIEGEDYQDLVSTHTRDAYRATEGIDAYFAKEFDYVEGRLRDA